MTQEEKAKRYDEAIEKAGERYNEEYTSTLERSTLAYVFPELAESEDEKIRKEIMDIIDSFEVAHLRAAGLPTRIPEYLAWLEKQGQTFTQKDIDDAYLKGVCDAKHELEKQGEQNVWSENDDIMVENIRNSFGLHCGQMTEALKEQYNKFFNKIKSLRPNHWKPDEMDIELLESIISGKSDPKNFQASLQGILGNLKKL